MVYDKLHDSTHPNAQKLDELYELVGKGIEALISYYVLHEYIGLREDYKFDLYDYLNQDYEDYVNAFNNMENKKEGDSSDSYYTFTSDSSK